VAGDLPAPAQGRVPVVVGRIDSGHLLVFGVPKLVFRYSDQPFSSQVLRDFTGLLVDGSVWARNQARTRFRNLVSGEERSVLRPAGVDDLDCVPAFCLGHGASASGCDGPAHTTYIGGND
jgi:hypothetical protein